MELNVTNASLEVSREVCRSENSFSAESDLIVPDNMPDILSILQISANAATSVCDPQTDRVLLTGNVFFNILYVADTPRREVKSLRTGAVFSNIFSAPGVRDQMPVFSGVKVSGISYKLTNCRKLSVHGELTGNISVYSNSELTLPTLIEGAEIKTEPIYCSVIKAVGNAQETVTDSFELSPAKPAALEILRDDVKISEKTVKIIHNKAIIKGMVGVSVLYNSDSGIQFVKNEIPFTKVVNVEGLEDGMEVDCSIDIQGWETELSSADGGEKRTIDVETMLYFNVAGRVSCNCNCITDAYFPGYKLECDTQALALSAASPKETEECSVKGSIKLPAAFGELETVHDISGSPRITGISSEEGELCIEGTVTVSMLLRTDNPDSPTVSYSYDADFRHVFSNEKYTQIPKVAAELKNMSYSVSSGNTIDIRGTVQLTLEAVSSFEKTIVTAVRLNEEDEKDTPSILISYLHENKSIWEIAKEYNISRSKLMSANNIKSEEELNGCKALVIPR